MTRVGEAGSTSASLFDFSPPTAGLPLRWRDFLPGGDHRLGEALAAELGLPAPLQIECSGTASLVIALSALRRQAPDRDEVVVPAYTCPLVALAVAHCGLRTRVCELLPGRLDMDPVALTALCSERTLAVVPTHLGGRVADAATARHCATAVGAWTIEDAAQALGAQVDGRSVGVDSDITFFSLAVGKGLTTFEGGAMFVRDPLLLEACRTVASELAPRRWGWEAWRSMQLLALGTVYRPVGLRWAYGLPLKQALKRGDWVEAAGEDFSKDIPLHRMGDWRRAVGVKALRRWPDFLARTRAQAERRLARLRGIEGVQVLDDASAGVVTGARGTWPVLLVLLKDRAWRDDVLRRHWTSGWGLSVPFVHALPDHPACAGLFSDARVGELPHARDLAGRLLAISNSPWLTEERFDQVCTALVES